MSAFLPKSVVKLRTTAAQNVEANLASMCGENTLKFVDGYANALGCPREFVFFPLLSTVAHFMGIKSRIRVTDLWTEPAILWIVVCARKGELKSPAGRILKKGLTEMETDLRAQYLEINPEASDDELPRLTVTHFSFEKLHDVMKKNNGSVCGFFDEMTLLYDAIQHSKGKSSVDRKIFLSLNGGDCWERDFLTGSSVIPATCLNIVGFIQPKYVIQLLAQDDADGFNDRQLFTCPPERKAYPDEVQTLPEKTPTPKEVYSLIQEAHQEETGKFKNAFAYKL